MKIPFFSNAKTRKSLNVFSLLFNLAVPLQGVTYNCPNRYSHLECIAGKEILYSRECLKKKIGGLLISCPLFSTLDYIKLTKIPIYY